MLYSSLGISYSNTDIVLYIPHWLTLSFIWLSGTNPGHYLQFCKTQNTSHGIIFH